MFKFRVVSLKLDRLGFRVAGNGRTLDDRLQRGERLAFGKTGRRDPTVKPVIHAEHVKIF